MTTRRVTTSPQPKSQPCRAASSKTSQRPAFSRNKIRMPRQERKGFERGSRFNAIRGTAPAAHRGLLESAAMPAGAADRVRSSLLMMGPEAARGQNDDLGRQLGLRATSGSVAQ